jgi:hypothetical protein
MKNSFKNSFEGKSYFWEKQLAIHLAPYYLTLKAF